MINTKSHQSGFTLIEVLISLFILTVIGGAVGVFQKDVFSLNSMISSNIVFQQEIRQVFKSMSSQIRSMSFSSIGAYPIGEATSTSFMFYDDVDNDGLKERLRYFLSGNIIQKGLLKPTGNPLSYNSDDEVITDLVHYIVNGSTPIFEYYDQNYDGTTPPLTMPDGLLSIRLIKITIVVDKDSTKNPGPLLMTTQVSMRNLKDNL
jgi:prepilin-type N-terminal cleavage/methylation domain-containing protein